MQTPGETAKNDTKEEKRKKRKRKEKGFPQPMYATAAPQRLSGIFSLTHYCRFEYSLVGD
jgi:hypothetical protein